MPRRSEYVPHCAVSRDLHQQQDNIINLQVDMYVLVSSAVLVGYKFVGLNQ